MGAWGMGIFDDDTALDISGEYKALLAFGTSEDEAYQLVKDDFLKDMVGTEGEGLFWIVMAAVQQKYGILLPEVKENALRVIDNGEDFTLQEVKGYDSDYKKREKALNGLKEKLLAPPLPKKKISKPSYSKPRWKLGDVVLSQIVCPAYKDKSWFYNKYVLYRVSYLKRTSVSCIKPDLAYYERVCSGLYNWIGDRIPDLSIIKNLDYCTYKYNYGQPEHHLFSMSWIPRNQKYTLFQRGCEYPMPPPSSESVVKNNSTGNIFTLLEYYGENFKALYDRFKSEKK